MKYLLCYGRVYRMTEERANEVIRRLAAKIPFHLADFGQDWTNLSICGELIDIGNMTVEEAQQRIGGF
jgi:hypothetical protein